MGRKLGYQKVRIANQQVLLAAQSKGSLGVSAGVQLASNMLATHPLSQHWADHINTKSQIDSGGNGSR